MSIFSVEYLWLLKICYDCRWICHCIEAVGREMASTYKIVDLMILIYMEGKFIDLSDLVVLVFEGFPNQLWLSLKLINILKLLYVRCDHNQLSQFWPEWKNYIHTYIDYMKLKAILINVNGCMDFVCLCMTI